MGFGSCRERERKSVSVSDMLQLQVTAKLETEDDVDGHDYVYYANFLYLLDEKKIQI